MSNEKRVYQCYVCGERLDTFEAFKEHIVQNHEEGREYILCPLERCKAPVRDLKAHFKAKHPYDKMPKKGQSRALVWKDISTKEGKMNTKKPHFRDGYMTSAKNGKDLHYRSGMECEVYELLERWEQVVKYEEEPFPVRYFFHGLQHDYYPDIRITYTDGTVEIWEVKPSSQTEIGRNKAKWAACNEYCMARQWKFMVLTERGMGKLREKIGKQERQKRTQVLNEQKETPTAENNPTTGDGPPA